MDITQTFYDNLAPHYDKLFLDWQRATQEQAQILSRLLQNYGFDTSARILDCACGIGTQAIGLANLGYSVTASDISSGALAEAKKRANAGQVTVRFEHADFCALAETFAEPFDVILVMDNALPHMLSRNALDSAIQSITGQISPGGILIASIRDYDTLLENKPPYSPPYIHKTGQSQRVSFQTWTWKDDHYTLIQYIIDDADTLQISKFECEYRATRRKELSDLLFAHGCQDVHWLFPEETGFYQPIVIAKK